MSRSAPALPRRYGLRLIAAAAVLLITSQGAEAQFSGPFINNIFPLAPRELRQHLTRAQAAVSEERYSDAVAEIGEVLNSATSDDFFLGAPGSSDAQVSLKTEALSLLGSMPLKGRKMYELQYGADAKNALESALTASDLARLTEVCRRFFHTKAGYEATLILGRYQLDQGRPLAAALTLKRVADVPNAASQYDPELSILVATCWLHAQQLDKAREVLLALKQRMPQTRIRLGDREVGLFGRDEGALAWLEGIVGGSRLSFVGAATEWTLYRGDQRRNASSAGGVPLLNFNWKAPTVNDPTDEGRVAQQYRQIGDRGDSLVCALQPLVVQDYAIVRQPESNKLIGINKRNGKRIWVYPAFDESPTAQAARQAQSNRGPNPAINVRTEELKQRIWEDHAFGQVSSDGRQVYVIDDLSYAPMPNVTMPQVFIGRGGRAIPNTTSTKNHNLLVALDLQKQGYIVWAVGGMIGDNPALAGAFFLGAPLPLGDQLYALAEFAGEIRLVCLDARTGALDWKQQLAVLTEEPYHIQWDRSRRLAGASPSLADGILVCPTSAGAVVAVDLATRTLRWGYQYPRTDSPQTFRGGGGFRGSVTTVTNNPNGSWLDSTATIADGCVMLTPPESQQLHCLDLLTGKARWSPIARDEMLFVACVHDGKIILVGKDRVKAIQLATGSPAWTSDIKLDGEATVGRGYYNDHYYYLPVTGRQICKIDLDAGKIEARAQTEIELGNLVAHENQLISVSPQAIASFVLLNEHLQKQLEERLAANANDLDALALKAQILLQEGKPDQSLSLLRKAHELAPDRPTIRSLLVKVMLALVRQDVATHLPLTDELMKLITEPGERRDVLRWRLQGLVQAKRTNEALEAFFELADQELAAATAGTASTDLSPVDRELSVRFDRWLQGQLRSLVDQADAATKSRIAHELEVRLQRTLPAGSINQLRMFLNLFGFHATSDSARLALIDKLIVADALLEAELISGELADRTDRKLAGAAQAALAVLYEKAKRPELAARAYQQLAAEFADSVCREGLTGGELAKRAGDVAAIKPYLEAAWPQGLVEVKESDPTNMPAPRMAYPLPVTNFYGAAPRGLKMSYDSQQFQLLVRADMGHTLAAAALRGNDGNPRRPYPSGNSGLSAKANGHLLMVNFGVDIAAMDALRGERSGDALLWRQETVEVDPNNPSTQRSFSPRATRNPLLGNRGMSFDAGARPSTSTGPLLAQGVAIQRGRQIICVDPVTGHSLWERSSSPQVEIPQQAEIFGDDEFLLIADGRPDSKSEEAIVLSAIDGSFIGRRQIDTPDRRWWSHGRRVLSWQDAAAGVMLRLDDVMAEGQDLWTKKVARGSRGTIIDGEELAILEPNGLFTIVSLATGRVRFTVPLDAQTSLSWIQIIRSRQRYLLLTSQEEGAGGAPIVTPLPIANSAQQSRMHGHVYAFSATTGKLQWQTPAFVAHHALPPDQPTESPLLFFVGTRQGQNNLATAVLVLDRRTGGKVYDSELKGAMAVSCDIVADPPRQVVTLTLLGQANRSIMFQLTDKPAPPQPPAQANNSGERPMGVVDRSIGAAISALNRGLDPRDLIPQFPREVTPAGR